MNYYERRKRKSRPMKKGETKTRQSLILVTEPM